MIKYKLEMETCRYLPLHRNTNYRDMTKIWTEKIYPNNEQLALGDTVGDLKC